MSVSDAPVQAAAVERAASASVTLNDAAAYLAEYGWIQGAYYDATATVFTPAACVVGAIGMVCYGGPVDAPALNYGDPGFTAFEVAVSFLEFFLVFKRDVGSAYEFNDAKGRQAQDVIDTLRTAAGLWARYAVSYE